VTYKILRLVLCAVQVLLTFQLRTIGQTADYFDKLLDSVGRYYVVLNVASLEYTGKVVIEKENLYVFFNETKGLDKERYKASVKETLASGSPLILENAETDKDGLFLIVKAASEHKFRLLRNSRMLDEYFAKGCVATISHFFVKRPDDTRADSTDCRQYVNTLNLKDRRIKEVLDGRDEATLISMLFEWNILSRFDGLSGRVVIETW
jgi:hypothetical protein